MIKSKQLTIQKTIKEAKKALKQGNLQVALNLYRGVLQNQPNHPVAKKELYRLIKKLPARQPSVTQTCKPPQDQVKTLAELYHSGQMTRAEKACEDLLRNFPESLIVLNIWGAVLRKQGKLHNAVMAFDRAIRLKPDYIEAYNNRGNALRDLGKLQEALNDYNKAIQLKPDYADAYLNRGNTLRNLGRLQEALTDYNTFIQFKPGYAKAYNNRGISLTHFGRFKEALSDYNKAIELKPDYAEVHRHISVLKKFKPDDTQIGIMERLIEKNESNDSDKMHLCFALAKAYEDVADYDKSFKFIKRGNDLRKKELNYSLEKDRSIINGVLRIIEKKLSLTPIKNDPVMPVFIVGMPRSGTTLVEQILASHSQVYGAGELDTMSYFGKKALSRYYSQGASQNNSQLLQKALNKLHDEYIKSLKDLNVTEKIITDKMPGNFIWIGFILSVFPKVKIINMNRDPRATCWSIYKHNFSSKGHGYAYDMLELAEYYNIYVDLMAFWRSCFPNKIYDLCYEELTENQEEETHKLLSYCGLEFEEQCIDFHKTERIVQTASAAQVRKKMYTGSSEDWKNFEKYMQPMLNKLPKID